MVAPLLCHQWLLGQVTNGNGSHSCTTSWARLLCRIFDTIFYSIFFTKKRGSWVQSRSGDLQKRSVSTAACCVTLGWSLALSDADRTLPPPLSLQLKPLLSCDSQLRFASLLNGSSRVCSLLLLHDRENQFASWGNEDIIISPRCPEIGTLQSKQACLPGSVTTEPGIWRLPGGGSTWPCLL